MYEPERRKIEELIARYEFEPELKDIYVEGPEDKFVLDGYFEEKGLAVAVFEIDSVDVPNKANRENSNRSRVIDLANQLNDELDASVENLFFLIDSDFDFIKNENKSENPRLLRTDYANLEMYFFSDSILEKFNRRCLKKRKITPETLNGFLIPTLKELFKIRYVNENPDWRLEYLPFEKLLQYEKGDFSFDYEKYLERYLNKNGRLRVLQKYKDQIKQYEIDERLDHRCFIHGHDFLATLLFVVNKLCGEKRYPSQDVLFDLLKSCADYEEFDKENLFTTFLSKFADH